MSALLNVVDTPGTNAVIRAHEELTRDFVPRSDLVLFQAENTPGEARFLYSAPGDFGTLAISQNGDWLLVGWVNANQWLFLRLTSAKVVSVSNIVEQFGGSSSAPLERAFPKSVSWCCPASP